MARILVVDDEEGIRSFLADSLMTEGHDVVEATDGNHALTLLRQQAFHVMITDMRMPGLDGMTLLQKAKAQLPEMEVVVLTAYGTVKTAVEAMKMGAIDFLQKPLSGPDEIRMIAARAIERCQLKAFKDHRQAQDSPPQLSFGAPAMKPVLDAIHKVAPTGASVLLTGETGTGKEVAARAIHRISSRTCGPFVAVNGAALSENLLHSELFGHEKGAFTGADARRRGKVELADGGTFFLDEIGELDASLQVKLLRVIQEKQFERLGSNRTLFSDVRWITATNRNLEAMVAERRFREDLYHRLAVFPIHIPPLRERKEDIPPLAQAILKRIARDLGRPHLRLDEITVQALMQHGWPGNVRELANVLERAAILAEGDTIHDVFAPTTTPPSDRSLHALHPPQTLEAMERQAIQAALERHAGHRQKAAEELGIGLRTLYDKLERYDLS